MAIPLLPVSVVIQTFDDLYDTVLQSSSTKIDSLKPLFDYYENQWIKKVGIERWNVYGLRMRTNNNAEGPYSQSISICFHYST